MLDVLVSYFRRGLLDGECCMWVTAEPLGVDQARAALQRVVPDLDERIRCGQIEFLDHTQWYLLDGGFDADRVLRGWIEREQQAIARGYAGLRLSGNVSWLDHADWASFTEYEKKIDSVIGSHRMMALCTYPLHGCGAFQILDVVRNHQFALIRKDDHWELIQSTHHQRTERILRQSQAQLQTIIENLDEGLVVCNLEGELFHWNRAALRMHGFADQEECRRTLPEFAHVFELSDMDGRVLPPDEWPLARILRGEHLRNLDLRIRRIQSDWERYFSYGGALVRDADGQPLLAIVTLTDITERKQEEDKLHRLNRTLKALTNSGQALLRAHDEKELLQEICRIVVEDCGHTMVWVGFAEHDEYKSVRPVASAGFDQGYLDALKVTWADVERGRGPTGTAIRTGKPFLCRNMIADPRFAPWRQMASERGYASSVVLPLMDGGRAFGALNIYSGQVDSFTDDEVRLLAELANDLAYGITAIRSRIARERAEEQVRLVARFPAENPSPVLRIGQDHVLAYANDAAKPLLDSWNCRVGDFVPQLQQAISGCMATGQRSELEVQVQERTFWLVLSPVMDGGYVNIYGRDITERKQTEIVLRKLSRAVEQSPATVVITDTQGNIEYVNPQFTRTTGYTVEEALGCNPRVLKSDHTPPETFKDLWDTLKSGHEWHGEFCNRKKNGEFYWESASISPVLDASGRTTHYVAVKIDTTERKLAEEAQRRAADELRRSNQELEQFAYVASHDLQEPLRMVTGYMQLLQRRYQGKLDADANEFIAYAVDGARRMSALIDDLLAYSRVGTRGGEFKPVPCEEVLERVLRVLMVSIQESGAAITHDPLPQVRGDATQLGQLFQNLLANAIKFRGDQPPQIHLSAEPVGGMWQFAARDNGIGIESRYFQRIFAMFQRLHGRDKYPGTGIGLAICKKIVERHGGRIWVKSELHRGSTFHFTLPGIGT